MTLKMKKKIFVAVLISILCLISICGIVFAENLGELKDKKEELENQIKDSNEQIEQIQIELTENLEEINKLDEKIYLYENEIAALTENLNGVEKEIKETEEKLNIIENNYNSQKETFENRMVSIYKSGDVVYLDVLLNSNSVSDFISNYYLIGELAKYDNQLLENIENQRIQIESIKEVLDEKRENIKTAKKNKEKTAIALENTKLVKTTYISKLTEQEKEMKQKIDNAQQELDNIESQIRKASTQDLGKDYVGGELAWPTPGYTTVTSPFGMRLHPVLKVNRLHTGIDIGAPSGANIVAANSGVVTQSTYTSGYGNMIIINHGGGISTVYAHGSKIIAKAGQVVERGEIIMKVGSTGMSTGPHLHFEVRVNGNYVDPLPYVTK